MPHQLVGVGPGGYAALVGAMAFLSCSISRAVATRLRSRSIRAVVAAICSLKGLKNSTYHPAMIAMQRSEPELQGMTELLQDHLLVVGFRGLWLMASLARSVGGLTTLGLPAARLSGSAMAIGFGCARLALARSWIPPSASRRRCRTRKDGLAALAGLALQAGDLDQGEVPLERRLAAQGREEAVDLARQRPVLGHRRREVDDQLFLGLAGARLGAVSSLAVARQRSDDRALGRGGRDGPQRRRTRRHGCSETVSTTFNRSWSAFFSASSLAWS